VLQPGIFDIAIFMNVMLVIFIIAICYPKLLLHFSLQLVAILRSSLVKIIRIKLCNPKQS